MNPTLLTCLRPLLGLAIGLFAFETLAGAKEQKIEIKYLIPNERKQEISEVKKSAKLDEAKAEKFPIYFFDTPDLDLLKREPNALILRLRIKDGAWQLTVKERPASSGAESAGGELEQDQTLGKAAMISASLDASVTKEAAEKAIESGDLAPLFSDAQKKFLEGKPDLSKVRCFPKIDALKWDLPQVEKLAAEQWDYAGETVLEFSVKAKLSKAPDAEKSFRQFLVDQKLDLDKSGGMKTETALKALRKSDQFSKAKSKLAAKP